MTETAPTAEAAARYHFEWDAAEFRHAHREVFGRALYPRWLRVLFWLALVSIVAAVGFAIWVAGDSRATVIVGMGPWLLLLVGWFALLRYGIGWIAARSWAKQNPAGHRTVTYGVGPSGLEARSYLGETTLRWVAIQRVVETAEFFLFYITWQCAHYIPKRVVSPEAAAHLRSEVRAHMPPEKINFLGDRDLAV